MDTVRYILALLLLVTLPPALGLWFLVHPLAAFWRRVGTVRTYILLGILGFGTMALLFFFRAPLLGADFGTNLLLLIPAMPILTGALFLGLSRRKLLTAGILSGLPEISPRRYPGKLLTDGIYAKIRHPRYVEVFLGVLGYALIANHLGSYLIVLFSIPGLYLVVLLEERELRRRFGAEYDEYCRKVPGFIPRIL